jgi:probable phosphoglycerate mutase
MFQIVLIRPGSTEYDRQGRIQGTLDIPLSAEGRQEVVRVIDELKDQDQPIEVLYTTACQAAEQTGEAIAGALNCKFKRLDKLRNLDQGLWQGMLIEDVKTKQPKVYRRWQEQPEKVCPPGGEMVSTAQQRVRSALSRLLKKHKQGMIGLVVPEPLASVVRNVLCQDQLADLWEASEGSHWEIITVEADVAVCEQGQFNGRR